MYCNLLSTVTKVTKDRGNLISIVALVMSWNEDLLDVDHRAHDIWGCVFQDMKPPEVYFTEELRHTENQSDVFRFTQAVVRHADIRDQNPSLGYICPGEPHQRNTNAPKFEDRSQEETEWQEQGAREAAWKLGQRVWKLKGENRATFFSPSENRCLPCTINPQIWGKRICSSIACDQQKVLACCWIENWRRREVPRQS